MFSLFFWLSRFQHGRRTANRCQEDGFVFSERVLFSQKWTTDVKISKVSSVVCCTDLCDPAARLLKEQLHHQITICIPVLVVLRSKLCFSLAGLMVDGESRHLEKCLNWSKPGPHFTTSHTTCAYHPHLVYPVICIFAKNFIYGFEILCKICKMVVMFMLSLIIFKII